MHHSFKGVSSTPWPQAIEKAGDSGDLHHALAAFCRSNGPGTFNLLGFTHYWAMSRKGRWVVKQKTAKDRFSRALRRLREWCRWHRHDPLEAQHLTLEKKLKGHYAYYGITGNYPALARLFDAVKHVWRKALERRSQQRLPWWKMRKLLERFPLPAPRIVHKYAI